MQRGYNDRMSNGLSGKSAGAGLGLAALMAVAVAGGAVWLVLGMNRGLLLSEGIKAKVWPWAPFMTAQKVEAGALSDPVWQFVPWLQLARRELAAGRLPLWNPHQNGGVPLLANSQCGVASPLVAPVLLAGVRQGWNLSLLLRILVAGCGAFLWLREVGRSPPAAALGALMFALGGPFIAWLEHPHTLVAAWAPWLLLVVEKLAVKPSRSVLAATALVSTAVLTGGHPETALMAGTLAVAALLARRIGGAGVARAFGAAFLGAGLAAPLLLPFARYLSLSAALGGAGRHPFVLPWADIVRFVKPHAAVGHPIEAAVTVSVTGLVCAVVGLVLGRREGRTLFWAAVAIVILGLTYDNPLARLVALRTPIHATRVLLLLPLPLGFLAASGLDGLRTRLGARWSRGAAVAAWVVVLLAGGELLAAARGVHAVTPPADVVAMTPLIRFLQSRPGIFRILPLHTFLPPNSATAFGLDDVRGYDALEPAGWLRVREAMGTFRSAPTVSDVLEPWDLKPGGAALDFWNVEYLLAHPQLRLDAEGWGRSLGLDLELVYDGPDGRVFRNRRVLPRVRCRRGGTVQVQHRDPLRWEMMVQAVVPDRLVVANPFFPGWQVFLDGGRVPLEGVPGQPIEVPVPPGDHVVELVYRPAAFRAGLWTAGVSLVLLMAWMAAARGKRSRAQKVEGAVPPA